MGNKIIIAILVLGASLSPGIGDSFQGQTAANSFIIKVSAIGFMGGVTIQENGEIINAPQWNIWSQWKGRSKPVAYMRNSSVQIWAKFVAEKSITQATIWAESGDVLGNLAQVTVDFVNGTSQYYKFTPENLAPNYLSKDVLKFQWRAIVDVSEQWLNTSEHIMYTILDNPVAPMETPWVKVLDKACQWGQGSLSEAEAAEAISIQEYIELDMEKTYYGGSTHAAGTTFYLNDFLNDTWGDCRDISAYYHILCRAVGISSAKVRRISYWTSYFCYKPILPFGYTSWSSGCWNFHQVGWYNNVYDPCIMVDQSDPKYPMDMDINGDYKYYVYDYGTWDTSESPFMYSSVY